MITVMITDVDQARNEVLERFSEDIQHFINTGLPTQYKNYQKTWKVGYQECLDDLKYAFDNWSGDHWTDQGEYLWEQEGE